MSCHSEHLDDGSQISYLLQNCNIYMDQSLALAHLQDRAGNWKINSMLNFYGS